ncbi:DNA polymerase I [Patescibacteria group bacterium]|nr:DNA polymerase I [Patescibacteria group bacterium]
MATRRKKLVLIDGNSLVHRGFHAFSRLNLTSPTGEHTGATYGFAFILLNILNKLKPDYIAVTFDTQTPTFRHEEYKEYKATRIKAPQELYDQIPRIQELVETFNIPMFLKDGFEADDIIGTLSAQAPKDIDTYIATGDMDTLQLVDNNTFVYAPRKGFSDMLIFDADTVKHLKGLAPSQMIDYKGLRGDPSDNIPGVPGIGEKGALQLLQEFGSIENLYKNLDKVPNRYHKLLEANREIAEQSKKLATIIRDVPIKLDLKLAVLKEYDEKKVRDLFYKLGFNSLMNKLPKSTAEQSLPIKETPSSPPLDKGGMGGVVKKTIKNQADKIDAELEPVLKRIESAGVLLDTKWITNLNKEVSAKLLELSGQIYKHSHQDFNINSPSQLATVLFEKLHLPTEGISKTKTGYSTAASELNKLKDAHPIIEPILEYRELEKLRNTYLETLPGLVDKDSRLHTHFAQNTSTGRLSSSEPNLQNIPIRTELGAEIRKAFIAPKGYQLISADYSQVELRVVAHISQDKRLLETFLKNEDVHTATAAEIEGVSMDEVTSAQRRKAKAVNFGLIYGISAHGLAEGTGMSYGEAKDYIEKYFALHPSVKKYIKDTILFAQQKGFVQTLLGRKRELPEVNSNIVNVRLAAERMAINAPIQGTAADIIKLAMIEIDKNLSKISPKSKMVLQIHDELLFEVPEGEISKAADFVKETMENIYPLDVPLTVNIESGPNWGDTRELSFRS